MKLFGLCLIMVLLSGCVATFNQTEYQGYVKVLTLTEPGEFECRPYNIGNLLEETTYLMHYTAHLPHNKYSADGAKQMHSIALYMFDHFQTYETRNLSESACVQLFDLIHTTADSFVGAVGGKPTW